MTQKSIEYLIIEDERTSADRLYRQIKRIDSGAAVYGPLTSVEETVEWFRTNNHADIILADVRLDDGLVFEALRHAPSTASVIFTTAYDEYAMKAFKYNSIDYLLKPIDIDELTDALIKAKKNIQAQDNVSVEAMMTLLNRSNGRYRERFLVACNDGFRVVDVNDIGHIYTESREVRLFLKNGTVETVNINMEELERQLDPDRFFRANRQYIVSIDNIEKLANQLGGKYKLILRHHPQTSIPISKEKAPLIKAWIDR